MGARRKAFLAGRWICVLLVFFLGKSVWDGYLPSENPSRWFDQESVGYRGDLLLVSGSLLLQSVGRSVAKTPFCSGVIALLALREVVVSEGRRQ